MLSVRVFNLYFRRELALRPQAMAMLALMLLFALLFILIYLRVAGRLSPQARKL
jgi:putative spermidine/putrescine transport system permease protein